MSKTTIILDDGDVAIAIKADGTYQVYIPKLQGDELVPANVEVVGMLMFVMSDAELFDGLLEQWRVKVDNISSQRQGTN